MTSKHVCSLVTGRLLLAVLGAVWGMFQFGYSTAVINAPQTVIKAFYNESHMLHYGRPMSHRTLSFMWPLSVAIMSVGGMIGGLAGVPWADRVGRKRAMLWNCGLGLVAAALMGFSRLAGSFEMIIIGRLVVGINCGLYTTLVPMYASEVAPVAVRGAVGVAGQLAATVGILLSQVLGLNDALGNQRYWPLLLGLTAMPPLMQLLMLPWSPESPRYLMLSCGSQPQAEKALRVLRQHDDVSAEINDMCHEQRTLANENKVSMGRMCCVSSLRLPLFVAVIMHLSQQLSGINCIFFYSTGLFTSVGLPESLSKLASLAVGGVMVVMTLVSIPLMDRAGRRVLHLVGLSGMLVFSAAFTVAFHYSQTVGGSALQITSVVFALMFVVFFGLGPGSIPWMIVPEFFSQGPRAAAVGIGVMVNWMAAFAVGLTFPALQNALQDLVLVPYTIFLGIFIVILIFLLPETKGRTVEEVGEAFNKINNRFCKGNGGSKTPELEQNVKDESDTETISSYL